MINSLQDKIAVVTGGSRGIGAGIVARFVELGAKVVFSYRSSAEEAQAIVDKLGAENVLAVKSDASVMDDAQGVLSQGVSPLGRQSIPAHRLLHVVAHRRFCPRVLRFNLSLCLWFGSFLPTRNEYLRGVNSSLTLIFPDSVISCLYSIRI